MHWSYKTCALGLIAVFSIPVSAQERITPDDTLGNERSRVTGGVNIRGGPADRIEGGATRDANLFHSFSEFNVNENQRVYFANPSGIDNILSRVTGTDVSDIMGTLGVDGGANLFLLNPNGIIFGPNARLDVSGSFTTSTANSFTFADGSVFSATTPGDASLLSVSAPLGVQYGPNSTGTLTNNGLLSVGRNLTLSSSSVTSTGGLDARFGQLIVEGVAGDVQVRDAVAQSATLSASNNLILPESQLFTASDLNLLAGNTVWIRDSIANPFVAQAGGNLTVQGNQNIDIFALNHPASGLISGHDMILRSANTVGGDAHYWTGGNFRIERLNGVPGNLFSPYDPVIRSIGDVEFNTYTGASLQIFAGGSVTAGDITITGADPVNGFRGGVTVSDPLDILPDRIISVNGVEQATLDIRAGVTDPSLLTPRLLMPPEVNFPGVGNVISPPDPNSLTPPTPSAPTITIGSITNRPGIDPSTGQPITGQILLTNQQQSSSSSVIAPILITGVIPDQGSQPSGLGLQSISAYGSDVTIAASGNVEIANSVISGISGGLSGGNITIYSGGRIDTGSLQSQVDAGNAGDISLRAVGRIHSGSLSSFAVTGNAGNVNLTANGNIVTGGIDSLVATDGDGGNIVIRSNTGSINTSSGVIQSSTLRGDAGDIRIISPEGNIRTDAVRSFVGEFDFSSEDNEDNIDDSRGRPGTGGDITLRAGGEIRSRGRIASFAGGSLSNPGNAGNIFLTAREDIDIISARSFVGSYDANDEDDTPQNGENGDAGSIFLRSRNGDIRLDTHPADILAFSNNDSRSSEIVFLLAERGSVFLDGAELSTTNEGTSSAGDILIIARDDVEINGSSLESRGFFGRIAIAALSDDGTTIAPSDNVTIRDSELNVNTLSQNSSSFNPDNSIETPFGSVDSEDVEAGSIAIITERLNIDNSDLKASINSDSDNGNSDNDNGRGGFIGLNVTGSLLRLDNDSDLIARARGGADGGNIELNVEDGFVLANSLDNSDIVASAEGDGTGGTIQIDTNAIFGLEERDPRTPLSDINASSEFGVDGEIVLNTLGVDPSRNPGELPIERVDAASLVAEGCLGGNRAGVDEQGELRRTGRGGVSRSPTDPLSGETTTPPLATLDDEKSQASGSIPPDTTVELLVEAQRLRRNANGKVSLVAERSPVAPAPIAPPDLCPPDS